MNTRCDAYILCCIRIHTNTYIYHIQTHFFLTFRIEYDVHTLATYKHIQLHTRAYTIVTYIQKHSVTTEYKHIQMHSSSYALGPLQNATVCVLYSCVFISSKCPCMHSPTMGCIWLQIATFLSAYKES